MYADCVIARSKALSELDTLIVQVARLEVALSASHSNPNPIIGTQGQAYTHSLHPVSQNRKNNKIA